MALLAMPATAATPGSNGKITWQRGDAPHVWIAEPDGSGARHVFGGGRTTLELEGTFSPTDANVMFFSRGGRAPFSEDIYRGDLTTGAVQRVTTAKSADIAPTLSPDGTQIAYFAVPRPRKFDPDRPPPPEQIHIANLDGSGDRRITPINRRSFDPDWSPDGKRLVYSETRLVGPRRPPLFRIMLINADGTGRRALSQFKRPEFLNPKWTPDGQTIIFERGQEHGTHSDIAAMPANGGPIRVILGTQAWETNPIPSPDGKRILFTSDRDRRGRDRLGPGFEVYTMAMDGTDIVRLTNNRSADIFPDWQRLP
jgi:TolB protein